MASAGLDADAVHRVDHKVKRRLGKLAYLQSAITCLRRGPLPVFDVSNEHDGIHYRACQFLAGNGRYYGGRFSITRDASLFEPRLDICLVEPMSRPRYLLTVFALLLGRSPAGVVRFATSRVQLYGEGIPLQLDGDACGHLPCTITMTEGEVQVVFPC
jgi:diacylglycerol kinase family enzyme